MSYNKYNPIHLIKGRRTIENLELLKKHMTKDESFKRTMLMYMMYLVPFIYLYLVLVSTTLLDVFEYRKYFYIPAPIFFLWAWWYRVKYELKIVNFCQERENNSYDINKYEQEQSK